MRKSLLAVGTMLAALHFAAIAAAQTATTTTTTTWTPEQGTVLREYTTTRNYSAYNDPAFVPSVGMALPGTVTVYALPESFDAPIREHYRYAVVNDRPVVVNTVTRRIEYMWVPAGGGGG